MPVTRRILSGQVRQGTSESRTYIADLQKWADEWGTPVSIESCKLLERRYGQDRSDLLSGSGSLAGAVVESPTVSGLSPNVYYQLTILINFPNSQKLSGYWLIKGEL